MELHSPLFYSDFGQISLLLLINFQLKRLLLYVYMGCFSSFLGYKLTIPTHHLHAIGEIAIYGEIDLSESEASSKFKNVPLVQTGLAKVDFSI